MRKDNSQSNTLYEFHHLILGKKIKKIKKNIRVITTFKKYFYF